MLPLVPAVSLLALTARAQTTPAVRGYGRFPCTIVDSVTGEFSADQQSCIDNNVATCVREAATGAYFCGISGARCDTRPCDGDPGFCYHPAPNQPEVGICIGGFGESPPSYAGCLGGLAPNADGTCGGLGAACGTLNPHGGQGLLDTYDQNCASNYCVLSTLTCGERVTNPGGSCDFDTIRGCGTGLYPNIDLSTDACTCETAPQLGPSQRSRARVRARRNSLKSLCPAGMEVCVVGVGFECVDTTSSLEQCGGCDTSGGVDCTTLDGVSAVGCVAGRCEIWACEDGFAYETKTGRCTRIDYAHVA